MGSIASQQGRTGSVPVRRGRAAPSPATPAALLAGAAEPTRVDIPAHRVLSIAGAGAPGDAVFRDSLGALFGVAYTLKFGQRKGGRTDLKIGPLMGEWHREGRPNARVRPALWRWQLEIAVPDDVTSADVGAAIRSAVTHEGGKLYGSALAERVRLARRPARPWVRMLHVGPYFTEPGTLEVMRRFAAREGLGCEPWHLEVYLSDPRRTAPSRLKTVLLIPIEASNKEGER